MSKKRCNKSFFGLTGVISLLLLCLTSAACAQEAILRFAFDPAEPTVVAGESLSISLRVQNESIYEADDVAVQLVETEIGFSLRSTPVSLKQIHPFGEANLDLVLSAPEMAGSETVKVGTEIIYSYCVDDVCFQIVENVILTVYVSEEALAPSSAKVRPSLLRWLVPTLGVVVLAGGICLWRFRGLTFPLYAVLFVLIAGGLTYGVIHRQHQQALGIGAVLCTSCVGIEEARHEGPVLSTRALTTLSTLRTDVELIVFYAPWCHSCPYAKAMVKQMSQASPGIAYRFINVDKQRELATTHGIIRSGRTIVPAILRADTSEVIFGVENLEERLLTLLKVESR